MHLNLGNSIAYFCAICMLSFSCSTDDVQSWELDGSADAQVVHSETTDLSYLDEKTDDGQILQGTFGASCTKSTDCDSGICIEERNGKICSKLCVEECPSGFECVENTFGTDSFFYCRSTWVTLCDPCLTNADCNIEGSSGNVCIKNQNNGSFCGVGCQNDDPNSCPKDYSCLLVEDPSLGKSTYQCVPDQDECTCSMRAKQLGKSTSCFTSNELGTCTGVRTCSNQGLTACSATIPAKEQCNLIDDDCDAVTDNIQENTYPCTVSNTFGECTGFVQSCDQKGNGICSASKPSPELCNGFDDDCDGNTDEEICDDGNTCTTDSCNTDGSCKHLDLTEFPCNDGNICTTNDVCATGKCVGGNSTLCTDNNPCTDDKCDPQTGCKYVANSASSCKDDGNACTQDICEFGVCVHPNNKDGISCESDGEVCTKDQCSNGQCDHVANTLKCDDGDKCTLNDYCKDTVCNGGPQKDCNDNNPCTIDLCEPTLGCYHKPAQVGDGNPCVDDGNPCTQDLCKGSQCAHIPIPGCG